MLWLFVDNLRCWEEAWWDVWDGQIPGLLLRCQIKLGFKLRLGWHVAYYFLRWCFVVSSELRERSKRLVLAWRYLHWLLQGWLWWSKLQLCFADHRCDESQEDWFCERTRRRGSCKCKYYLTQDFAILLHCMWTPSFISSSCIHGEDEANELIQRGNSINAED